LFFFWGHNLCLENAEKAYFNFSNRNLSLLWPNGKTSLPVIAFNPKVVRKTVWECKKIGGIFYF
jgi:hypothetical protein